MVAASGEADTKDSRETDFDQMKVSVDVPPLGSLECLLWAATKEALLG